MYGATRCDQHPASALHHALPGRVGAFEETEPGLETSEQFVRVQIYLEAQGAAEALNQGDAGCGRAVARPSGLIIPTCMIIWSAGARWITSVRASIAWARRTDRGSNDCWIAHSASRLAVSRHGLLIRDPEQPWLGLDASTRSTALRPPPFGTALRLAPRPAGTPHSDELEP